MFIAARDESFLELQRSDTRFERSWMPLLWSLDQNGTTRAINISLLLELVSRLAAAKQIQC